MKSKILLVIILAGLAGYLAEVAHGRQEMIVYPDGKITVNAVGDKRPVYAAYSREKLNGKEYIKINLSELSDICVNQDAEKLKANYVLRGSVYREARLDAAGQFGVVRLGIFCCAVHAVPIGLLVQDEKYNERQKDEWVQIYGSLKRVKQHTNKGKGHGNDPYAAAKEEYVIIPDKIVKIDVPSDPYIYLSNCQQQEPYYY